MTTETKIFTRSEYMAGKISHKDYYDQFVTDQMVKEIGQAIGIARIKNSKHSSFNDIPLHRWDRLSPMIISMSSDIHKQTGEIASLGASVCIAKAAARRIRGPFEG